MEARPSMLQPVPKNRAPLKDQNRLPLLAVLAANLFVLIFIVKTGQLVAPADMGTLTHQWRDFLPAGIGAAFAAVVNGLIDSDMKARLVFWRWSHPLPGCFAFSRYLNRDSRIDAKALRKTLGRLPTKPEAQNALWYRLYKSVEREPSVVHAHRHYLLTRDYTAIAFLLLVTAAPLGAWLIGTWGTAAAYAGMLAAQYLLARQAASHYGVRLVSTVLALKAVA